MSITYGFFNATQNGDTYDREYTADQLSAYLDGIVGNGVFPNPSTSLQVMASATPNMNITIKEGKGWIDGYWIKVDADYSIAISSASATLNRIDRVVFRWDFENRSMSIVVKQGTPASSPTAPTVTRNSLIKEYSLATISILANQTTITQAKITDTRSNSTVCGWVAGIVQQIDTTTLFNQYQNAQNTFITEEQAAFDAWFEDVQSTLASATILRRYSNSVQTVAGQTSYQIGITPFNSTIDTLNVLMEGIRLRPTTDYTFTNSSVTLVNAPIANNSLDFEVFRNVNGADCVTVIEEVEELQTEMARELKYKYYATGTNDNVAINTIINNFYLGADQFAGISEYSQLNLEVIGELGTSVVVDSGNYIFKWNKPSGNTKRVVVDFSNCARISVNQTVNIVLLSTNTTIIKNLYATVLTTGTAFGVVGEGMTLENCDITAIGTSATGFSGYGIIENTKLLSYSSTTTGYSQGVSLNAGTSRIDKCNLAGYRKTGSTNAYVAGLYMNMSTAIAVISNTNFPLSAVSGYEQLNSVKLTNGKYSLIGNVIGVTKDLTGATGTETGSINL